MEKTKGLKPISKGVMRNIINNLLYECYHGGLEKLNPSAYNFLYLANGFIAHYDRFGFIAEYKNIHNLYIDILKYEKDNEYRNFSSKDKDYDYYMKKKEIYVLICKGIRNRAPGQYE